MRLLPALQLGPPALTLPMADRSAAALAEALLCENRSEAAALVAEQMMGDPPLALWTVLRAWQAEQLRPGSVDGLARWLIEHALDVLQWEPVPDTSQAIGASPQTERQADLVAAGLATADMAALLSAADGQAAAEEAFLLGLIHEAEAWLRAIPLDEGTTPETAAAALPDWIVQAGEGPAGRRVAEAVELLAEESPAGPCDFDPQGCLRRAEEGRRLWLEAVHGPGDRLPELCAKLARLAALETRFQEVLEAEKLDSMAEFAAGAGHEINNPLAIIGGRAQLLLRDETDPERRHELAVVNAQVRRAYEMIADMRLFARPPKPEPETVDLVSLVDAMIEDLGPQMAERAVVLARSGAAGPLEIEADPAQLHVALGAMCKNAMEAIGRDGRIEVELQSAGDDVAIRVSDTGPGISPQERRHLFDPFYSARQAGRGLGLGLSKCWRIVQAHGGRIEVQSTPGEGATFTITLPRRQGVGVSGGTA